MAVWLLVERLENWQVDEAEGFQRFGLPASAAERAKELRQGTHLFSTFPAALVPSPISGRLAPTGRAAAKRGRLRYGLPASHTHEAHLNFGPRQVASDARDRVQFVDLCEQGLAADDANDGTEAQ